MGRVYFVLDNDAGLRIMRRLQELVVLCGDVSTRLVSGNAAFANHLDSCEPIAFFEAPDGSRFPNSYLRRISDPLKGDPARGLSVPQRLLDFFGPHPFTAIAVRPGATADSPARLQVPCVHGDETVMLHPLTNALRDVHYRDANGVEWLGPKRKRPPRDRRDRFERRERMGLEGYVHP